MAGLLESTLALVFFVDLVGKCGPYTEFRTHKQLNAIGKDVAEAYRVLHKYKKEGKIRSVGVSNFNIHHLEAIKSLGLPLPSVNQIEIHPFLAMNELIEYCRKEGIVIEAYAPLCKADPIASKNELLGVIGKQYNKTWAQVTFSLPLSPSLPLSLSLSLSSSQSPPNCLQLNPMRVYVGALTRRVKFQNAYVILSL